MKSLFSADPNTGTGLSMILIAGAGIGGLIAIIGLFTTMFFVRKKKQAGNSLITVYQADVTEIGLRLATHPEGGQLTGRLWYGLEKLSTPNTLLHVKKTLNYTLSDRLTGASWFALVGIFRLSTYC